MAAAALVVPTIVAPMLAPSSATAAPTKPAPAKAASAAARFIADPQHSGGASPASQSSLSVTPAPGSSPMVAPPVSGVSPRETAAIGAALRRAKSSGTAVSVPDETTETQTMIANPTGTVTVTSNVFPVRVRRGTGWAAIDPSLRRAADGSYSPAATPAAVRLSGGGTGALATLGTGTSGLTLTWPGRLPAPTVSGATATYRDVLPGVDLALTTNEFGGVSEALEVHGAKAAANPKLRALAMGLTPHGLTVSSDSAGNLSATDSHNEVAYTSPRPANAGVSVARTGVTLRPDTSALNAVTATATATTAITWNPKQANGAKQAFDEIQQGCPSTSNYNSTTYSGNPAVGLNSFSDCIGKERSFWRVAIPSAIWGTHVVGATVNTIETDSSSCSASGTVHLWSTGGISASTTWSHPPTMSTDVTSTSVGPACTSSPPVSFTVTSKAVDAAAGKWTSWTFGLVGNETSGTYRKRFETNPSIQITYNHIPGVPTSPAAAAGSANVGCATATPYPWMGSTAGVTPPTMQAKVSDTDGGQVQGTFSYWVDGTTTKSTLTSIVTSGGTAKVSFPSSFISGLTAGKVVDWQVQATDGKDTSGWTSVCHFGVDLTAPPAPTVTSSDGKYPAADTGVLGAPAGTQGSFKLAVSTATKFVYSMDVVPPTSNPPAADIVSATSGAATIPATPLAPGTHTIWAYALDQAGNESTLGSYRFAVSGHAAATFASLSAAFNNTAISSDTAVTSGNADGDGNSLSAQDLETAGWQPGGRVTVDGATFTLPTFGAGQADNVLAANQTITMPAGTRGNAVVFLAMSTSAYAQAPDSLDGDVTSPAVPAGASVTGTGCTYVNGVPSDCQPASGAISYGSAAAAQSYYLTVPDWVIGPQPQSVIQLPHRNTPAGHVTSTPKIYAFAVPLNPSVPIASVTLPDVSNSVGQLHMPGLHIFGIAVRDTAAAPNGNAWTGAWSAPNEALVNYFAGTNYSNQTFRIAATPSVAGNSVRIKLSDALGADPLTVDHVTVATAGTGAAAATTPINLTFGGSAGVTVPIGGEVYSDPLTFAVSPSQPVMVSLHLVNSVAKLIEHGWATSTTMWVSAPGSGDHTADVAATAWSGTGYAWGYFTDILTGIDVIAPGNPGTVAVLGDNLTSPGATGSKAIVHGRNEVSVGLATALRGNTQGITDFGVVTAGIEGNAVARDINGAGGPSALSRLDRDVLSEPGIGTVVVTEGLADVLYGTSADDLEDAYTTLATQLNAWGITVVFLTLTPCDGYTPCTTAIDGQRSAANDWLSSQDSTIFLPYVSGVDANAAVAIDDPASTSTPPEQILNNGAAPADADSGDHLNLSNDGYATITAAIPLTALQAVTPPQY